VDDQGGVIGLWPALAVDGSGVVHVVQRDVHFGNDQSAFDTGNVEYGAFTGSGSTASKQVGEMVASNRVGPPCTVGVPPCSASGKVLVAGAGNYMRMALVGGQPAVSFVTASNSATESIQLWFARRQGAGSWVLQQVSAATGAAGHPPTRAGSATAGAGGTPVFAIAYYVASYVNTTISGDDLRIAVSPEIPSTPDAGSWVDDPVETLGVTGLHPAAAFGGSDGKTLGVLYAYCRSPIDPASPPCNPTDKRLRFRAASTASGALFAADVESVGVVVPDATALVADRQGRFVAVWRDPALGVRASRRTP
jgi:hypothetical protein